VLKQAAERLHAGLSTIIRPRGNSMTPLIVSGQQVRIEPVELNNVVKGDIVLCRVRGRYYLHLVKAVSNKQGLLIANNRGHVNGWTKVVFGIVTSRANDLESEA